MKARDAKGVLYSDRREVNSFYITYEYVSRGTTKQMMEDRAKLRKINQIRKVLEVR